MRIPIREQLAGLVVLASGLGLMIIALATWYTNHSFVLDIRSTRLSLTASLKAAQLVSSLNLIQNSAQFVSSRVLIQSALRRYNAQGNNTAANWINAANDMQAAIGGGNTGGIGQALLLQTKIFPKNASGLAGPSSLLNVTGQNIPEIQLPYSSPNGSRVLLGDPDYGYPSELYPNLTYTSEYINDTFSAAQAIYNGQTLKGPNSTLVIGPYHVNASFSLLSLTLPIINNTSAIDVLGWLSIVCDARLLAEITTSPEGLGKTGETLLIGPTNTTNHFPNNVLWDSSDGPTADPSNVSVQYLWPLPPTSKNRHPTAAAQVYPPPSPWSSSPLLAKLSWRTRNLSIMLEVRSMRRMKLATKYPSALPC
ncbi:hypothetical protein AAFC00_000707 [Neodothiora populina]|uniref:Flp pilus-assembly TadG-like N-terminal domain-containing protein n=1 Tax=Neodothiora populina TaxID=2781224 RepID=A0ABR3PDR3_9PEZI